jgi:hypothetical protein
MFILTLYGRETDGAYAVKNQYGEQVLYMFEEEDDATRYAIMLEDDNYPEMHIIEVDDESMIQTCETHGYKYAIIKSDDFVMPPKEDDNF